ncbi:MAG: glycerophosphodiester phosphodiesterase family protein [Rikenellaceae bacterium]
MKNIVKRVSIAALAMVVILIGVIVFNSVRISSTPLEQKYIAHAGGILDGHIYTNTVEAAERSARLGYKYIEIDFLVTSDDQLIAGHDWQSFNKLTGFECNGGSPTTFEEAKSRKYLDYNVAGADDIARFFEAHPDMILVTDKVDDPRLLDKYFANMKDRLLVESFGGAYRYLRLKEQGYTPMLSISWSFRSLFHPKLILTGGVEWAAMDYSSMSKYKLWFMSKVLGIKLALFTIDDPDKCEEFGKYGTLIYTNSRLHGGN